VTAEEAMKDELLVRLCCGERCMAPATGDGICERWTFSHQADLILAQAKMSAGDKLASLINPKRQD
jgi:hypothetical protein